MCYMFVSSVGDRLVFRWWWWCLCVCGISARSNLFAVYCRPSCVFVGLLPRPVGSQGYCKHPWLEAGFGFWGFQSDVCSSRLLVPSRRFTSCVPSCGLCGGRWHDTYCVCKYLVNESLQLITARVLFLLLFHWFLCDNTVLAKVIQGELSPNTLGQS